MCQFLTPTSSLVILLNDFNGVNVKLRTIQNILKFRICCDKFTIFLSEKYLHPCSLLPSCQMYQTDYQVQEQTVHQVTTLSAGSTEPTSQQLCVQTIILHSVNFENSLIIFQKDLEQIVTEMVLMECISLLYPLQHIKSPKLKVLRNYENSRWPPSWPRIIKIV